MSQLFDCQFPDLFLCSWTWEQYKAAFAVKPELFIEASTEEELEQRFYYGGGSIRLVSMLSPYDLKNEVDGIIGRLPNGYAILFSQQGPFSASAVNSAQSMRPGSERNTPVYFPLSQYLVKRLRSKLDIESKNSLITACSNNPAWQGWAFELLVLEAMAGLVEQNKNLMHTASSQLYGFHLLCGDTQWSITAKSTMDYSVKKYLGLPQGDTIYFPNKWNQGCFDVVLYTQTNQGMQFDFINATLSTKHPFKCKYINEFLASVVGVPDQPLDNLVVRLHALTTFEKKEYFSPHNCEVLDAEGVDIFGHFIKEVNVLTTPRGFFL